MIENLNNNLLRVARTNVQTLRDFEQLRIKYILGDISKEKMASDIYMRDQQRKKNAELVNVYEILSAVGVDLFNRLYASISTTPQNQFSVKVFECLDEYNQLRIYANGLLATISNTYSMSVPQIDPHWKIENQIFNQKKLTQLTKISSSDKKTADAAVPAAAVPGAAVPAAISAYLADVAAPIPVPAPIPAYTYDAAAVAVAIEL